MSQWQGYIIATVIGLLIGIERERSSPKEKIMGLRTFLLITLLGALAGDLQIPWLSAMLALFTLGLIVVGYFSQVNTRDSKEDRGLTTEFAGAMVFCLGFAAHESPILVAILGPIVALLLLSKSLLHKFTRSIKPSELEAALLLLLFGTVVFNLMPDKTVDPWGIFNPRQFSMLVMILATVEFLSYLTIKIFGERKGALFSGLFGGLVSSTAVLLSSAKNAKKQPRTSSMQLVIVLTAILGSLAEVGFIVLLVAPKLLALIGWPLAGGVAIGLVVLYFVAPKDKVRDFGLILKSPLDWKGVFRLAVLLAVILLLISATKHGFGENAGLAVSFLTGLFELHGVSLANATMFAQEKLSAATSGLGILSAVVASLVAKATLAWMIERGRFARNLSIALLPIGVAIGVLSWLFLINQIT